MTVAFKGVNLVVSIKGGRAWIKVWVDGKIDPDIGAAGRVYNNGKTLTFNAKESIEVRTGSSGVTKFTLNGDVARRPGSQRNARDVAVRATRRARADPAPLTDVPTDRRGAPGPRRARRGVACAPAGGRSRPPNRAPAGWSPT